ncbi:MAG TPA: PAS domain-containing methyl-accepting chemotaxis protein [Polyangiaceae bacterium]|nr:PAS domain-containing methyl-accepting chemotaxis protein [Polyangiaceae bacterium]
MTTIPKKQTARASKSTASKGASVSKAQLSKPQISQEELQDMQGQISAISRTMAVIEFDLDGTIRSANDNFLAAVGYRREEVVGRHHRMFVEPAYADSAEYREFWEKLRAGQFHAGEFKRVGKGGRLVKLQASYNPIFDAQGRPYKVIKYAADRTADDNEARAKEMVEMLRIRSALDGSTTAVMIADTNFNIVYMNAAVKKLLTTHEAAIQKDIPQFQVEGLLGRSIDSFHRNPAHQRNVLQKARGSHFARISAGGRRMDLMTTTAIGADGKVAGYTVIWNDVTDQVNAQNDVERVLKAAIDGDLTQRLEASQYEGFLKSIAEGMNHLLDSVAESFGHVKVAIDQVGEASTQLRSTSQLMSSSSVGLNTAAMDSAGALQRSSEMVNANAENAAMANQLVSLTSTAAQSGTSRMQEMSNAMSEINSSAQQIAKIIKVIDEIAFQTNLLALNAAVEAARAGRHGKGFAVVAQEVRSLAERSAKAAKETAQLIEDSVSKVADGVRIADATRGALQEIVGNVGKVVDLVGEIATASSEQSRTIKQVTDSMGQVTEGAQAGSQQSNEVAAAAEEMSRQMEIVRKRMAKYRVPSVNNGGLPDVSPEMLAQLANLLRQQGVSLPGNGFRPPPLPAPIHLSGSNGHSHSNGHANGHKNGHSDPKSVLPLDRDERGFGGF